MFTTELITSSARSAKFGTITTDGVSPYSISDANVYEVTLYKPAINIEHNINFILSSFIFI
jgi:hypothetical protein